jgi:hypothetical protein
MTIGPDLFDRGRRFDCLFGVPLDLPVSEADQLLAGLLLILDAQFEAAGKQRVLALMASNDSPPGTDELKVFSTWFDPTAKGERIRAELARLPITETAFPHASEEIVVDGGHGRHLVTPEGWLVIRCLRRAEGRSDVEGQRTGSAQGRRRITESDARSSRDALLDTYRAWTRRRVEDVVGLLTSETSTLRPAAAGLLFTLLVNRNTSVDRALRRPTDPRQLAIVAEAIAAPTLAYAEGLSGQRNSARSIDLYRGWALGELRRRLGPGLHVAPEEGIWLDETATEEAVRRLIEDIRRRKGPSRARIPAAVTAALAAYDARRPELAGLKLAFERPANTRRLAAVLIEAAGEDPQALLGSAAGGGPR